LSPLDYLTIRTLIFLIKGTTINKYPTVRLDYNLTQKFRSRDRRMRPIPTHQRGGPPFPGPLYANQLIAISQELSDCDGFDWDLKSNLVNAFRWGISTPVSPIIAGFGTPPRPWSSKATCQFGFGLNSVSTGFQLSEGRFALSGAEREDDFIWQRGRHNFAFGVESATEIDHYYNNPIVPISG